MQIDDSVVDRKNSFENIEGILALEGFKLSDAPEWYAALRAQVIAGEITHDEALKIVIDNAKDGNL